MLKPAILIASLYAVAASAQVLPDGRQAGVDPATVPMPSLAFTPTASIERDYDKYFYFVRTGITYSIALADIRECDIFARGLVNMFDQNGTFVGRGLAGAFAATVLGPGEVRKVRRTNIRRCMHYKGYRRYGLKKDLWQKFNVEEGVNPMDDVERDRYVVQQAKVAAEANPKSKELGL